MNDESKLEKTSKTLMISASCLMLLLIVCAIGASSIKETYSATNTGNSTGSTTGNSTAGNSSQTTPKSSPSTTSKSSSPASSQPMTGNSNQATPKSSSSTTPKSSSPASSQPMTGNSNQATPKSSSPTNPKSSSTPTCSNGYTYRNGDQGYGCYGEPIRNSNNKITCAAGGYDESTGYCFTTSGINGNSGQTRTCPDGSLATSGSAGYGCYTQPTTKEEQTVKDKKTCDSGVMISSTDSECSSLEKQGYSCTTDTSAGAGASWIYDCVKYETTKTKTCPSGTTPQSNGTCFASTDQPSNSNKNSSNSSSNNWYNPVSDPNSPQYDPTSPNYEPEKDPTNPSYNPQTGSISIFIAWIVALLAIGYSFYYYKKQV